jgi:hypothetical protein
MPKSMKIQQITAFITSEGWKTENNQCLAVRELSEIYKVMILLTNNHCFCILRK